MPLKYRLIANQSNIEKQVFSVEEKNDGTLIIVFPIYPFMAFQDTDFPKVLNNKFTVHLSKKSDPPANTLTHEVLFKNEKFHRGHAHIIKNADGHLIWPVITKSLGFEESEYHKPVRHSNDKYHFLPPYNPENQSLIIALVILDKDVAKIEISPLRYVFLNLSKFVLVTYFQIFDLPSYRNNLQRVGYTSSILGVGHQDLSGGMIDRVSLSATELAAYLQDGFEHLIRWNISKPDHPVRQ